MSFHGPSPLLIGFMCAGKSTVGRALAPMLGVPFIDLDREVEKRVGPLLPFIQREGEQAFRAMEREVLDEVLRGPVRVIATGGGMPCEGDNLLRMKASGTVIWLDVPMPDLMPRIVRAGGDRPLLFLGVLLIVVAAGILAYGVRALQTAGWLPGLQSTAFDLSAASSRPVQLTVDLPSDAVPGRYRAIVTAANLADLWLVLAVDVLAAAPGAAAPGAAGAGAVDPSGTKRVGPPFPAADDSR